MAIQFATGPSVRKVSRAQALAAVKRNPDFPKGAEITVTELNGFWVAAAYVPDRDPEFKTAGPFPPSGGGPADENEESPAPKSEGPGDTKPEPRDDGDLDSDDDGDDEGGDKPPFGGGDKKDGPPGGKGDDALLHKVLDIVQQLAQALGLPAVPGAGGLPGGGPDGPPAPPGGPPGGPPHGPGGPEEVKHERAMKPGEVPAGGTPVGAPAFSHRINPHPWAEVIGKKRAFPVVERIPEEHTMAAVDRELTELCEGTGYKVAQILEGRDDKGHRIARALIVDPRRVDAS